MRTALKLVIVLIAAAAMAWCCVFIYWQLKIGRAIAELQHGVPSSRAALQAAGCRSLSYLVATSTSSESVTFLGDAHGLIFGHVLDLARNSPPDVAAIAKDLKVLISLKIEPLDTTEIRQAKCRDLRAWWQEAGPRYHQSWRIWSRRCR